MDQYCLLQKAEMLCDVQLIVRFFCERVVMWLHHFVMLCSVVGHFLGGFLYFILRRVTGTCVPKWRLLLRLTQLSPRVTHYQVTAEIEFVKSTILKVSIAPYCKQFSSYVFPKKIKPSLTSLLTSTKYFQSRIIMFCLKLWYSIYKVQDAAIQLSAYTKMVPWICYFLF